ncbi:MAG TPA: hypothetical protein VMS21_01175 [Methylomirabilota bacterium]|nr:hypothetical protein [Methylomirabilota bacterium]
MRRRRTLVITTIVLAVFLVCAWVVLRRGPPPEAPLPNPNGYDDLIRAAAGLTRPGIDYNATQAQLKQFVMENAEPLLLAREGLSKECRTPLGTNRWEDSLLKSMARAFCIEARFLSLSGDTNAAARACLDAARVGDMGFHGGLSIDHLVELAIEAHALDQLALLVDGLDASQCRLLIGPILALEQDDEDLKSILKRDRAWTQHALSSGERLRLMGERLRLMWESRSLRLSSGAVMAKIKDRRVRTHRQIRQQVVDLAVRAFELENGRSPLSAEELVPAYLEEIPTDPETGAPLNWDSSGGY